MAFSGQVKHAVLPFWRDLHRLMDKRMMFDDACGVFRHFFHKCFQAEGVFRIIGVLVAVATEGRGEKDHFLVAEERIFLVEFLPCFTFSLPVEECICPWHAESLHLAGRNGEGFRVDVADCFAADADEVIVSVIHGALRRAAGLAHSGEAEGLKGAAGVPELDNLGLPADVQLVELRVEVLQDDYPGFGTFSGTLPQVFFI